jgi:HEAT repeat protein
MSLEKRGEHMQAVINFITGLSVYVYGAAAAVLVVVAVVVIVALTGRRRFLRRISEYMEIPGTRNRRDYFADDELLRRTRLVEKATARFGRKVVPALEADELWISRLASQGSAADFRRVLEYAKDKGLFTCFLVALKNAGLRKKLAAYLAENRDFLVLRQLAASGRGEDFDGSDARRFFADRVEEIREMTGDPEWPSRYFAVKILLHDDDERSTRALWAGFDDPHPLVRRTVASLFSTDERQKLYDKLISLFRTDPVFEVREAARDRIRADFSDLYTFDATSLPTEEALHTVELLDPESEDDENVALTLLAGDNLELRLTAARFLLRCGTLERMFLQADLGDREGLERTLSLLTNAAGVSINSFLGAVRKNPGTGTLLVAAKLLQSTGPAALLVETAERVFRLQTEATPNLEEIYGETVKAVSLRGSDEALRLLEREIVKRRSTPALLAMALAAVPAGADHVFASTLMEALKDPDFPNRDDLRAAIARLETGSVLAETHAIITGGRDRYAHIVRIDALKLLGELNLPYVLQDILEHLPILPLEEAREYAAMLQKQQPQELERKTRALLAALDGNIRAAIIAALPATGKKTFLPEIRKALGDADPDVRIAATWALVDYRENRALAQATSMLRDPVSRVRSQVARALGTAGTTAALDALGESVTDPNEVRSVKSAAIEGLSNSTEPRAVDVLTTVIDQDEDLRPDAITALSRKNEKNSIARMVEQFKDAAPDLREHITLAFKMMGEDSEQAITAVLEEDIASLKPYLADILEATGYVESRIRMLNHRDPRVRREAALFLSRVGSPAAFRGIVMAARDPDNDVRVQVTKALERLATEEGKEILRALEEDPDRRIRKYTHWALQRIQAKEL